MYKKTALLIISITLVFSVFSNAFAYNHTLDGYYSKTCTIQNLFASGYSSAFISAMSDWNATSSPQKFSADTNSSNRAYCTYIADTSYGFYLAITQNSSGYHRTTTFDLVINQYMIPPVTDLRIPRSSCSHELGHSIGLNHNWTLNGTIIMDIDRNRLTIYSPQPDDILGAVASWNR